MGTEYRYRIDANGVIHAAGEPRSSWYPIASMSLDGVQRTTKLGPFGTCERDLLRVMAALLEIDRLSPRRPTEGSRLQKDAAWQRLLYIQISVEAPDRWTSVAPLLKSLLAFMTNDTWELQFEGIVDAPVQLGLLEPVVSATEIALFSGGLDSVAGMLAHSRLRQRKFLAVSACGNDVRGYAQRSALDALTSIGVSVEWLRLRHQLKDANRSRREMERSQRTRGLLFLAMGAVAASQLRLPTFNMYETGVGCINLSMSAAQVGAQGTRAMHPRTLALFNTLVGQVIERPVRAVAPFFLHTKGELCRLAGPDLAQIASVSSSCDEGEGHKRDMMLHCGLCTSCLFRRVALHSGGLLPDVTHYRDQATARHGVYEVNAFEHHAAQLSRCASFADLVQLDPDVRFSISIPVADISSAPESASAVFEMYRRYATEVQQFLAVARPAIGRRPSQPRKETENDLFSAVG